MGAADEVLILGAEGVAEVSAASVMLTDTGTAGALAYAAWDMPTAAGSNHHTTRVTRPAPQPAPALP